MLTLDPTSIEVTDRQRTKIDPKPLSELKTSILERGLLHAPGIRQEEEKSFLVYGERRLRAIQELHKEQKTFTFDGIEYPPGAAPFVEVLKDLTLADILQIEFDENHLREELDWQDRTRALDAIYRARQVENPKVTFTEVAKEALAASGGKVVVSTSGDTVSNPVKLSRRIREASIIVEHLNNPSISKARNANEAFALILQQEESRVNSLLAQRKFASTAQVEKRPDVFVRRGDAVEILSNLEEDTVDLICADPPYGIDAGSGGFRSRTVHHHNYEDTVESARNLLRSIITEGFRLSKPRANLFLFTDIKHWEWLSTLAARAGWVPFRTPIIWQKSESEGLAPWGGAGFRRTYELIFYATKGKRGLITSPVDILSVKRVPRHQRIHAAEKPVELIRKLIECSTSPGDFVLDPCCGSGSTLVAAQELSRRALGIEKDENYYNTAMANIFKNGEQDDEESDSVYPEGRGILAPVGNEGQS